MFCLNVCEIFRKELLEGKRLEVLAELARKESGHEEEELSRIYGGSSFCSQYFLHINGWKELIQHCQENGWKMTLTVPVFTQKLEIGVYLEQQLDGFYKYAYNNE